MEGIESFMIDLALILSVAGVITLIFKLIKLPAVLGYIVAGFIVSPNFKWMSTVIDGESIKLWADIGIIFLMFALGLEFSFKQIAKIGGSAIIAAVTVMGSMLGIGYLTGHFMGWSHMNCLFLGGMISMSSTMIILKAYEEYNLKKEKFASIVLGTLVIEDLGGIFMMVILSTLAVGQNSGGVDVFLNIGKLLGFLIIWVAVGIFLLPSLMKRISKFLNEEMLVIVSLAICFLMVVIGVKIGFSSALGAFLSGAILAGTVNAARIEKVIKPFKDLFGAIFFVSVGMMLVPEMVVEYIVPIIIITLVTIVGQSLFSTIGILISGQSLHTAVRGGSSMLQIGEFSFIVAALGTSLGVTSDFLYPIVVCVSVITSFMTPMFIKNSERTYGLLEKILPNKLINVINRYNRDGNDTNSKKDSDWKQYLSGYLKKIIFCCAGLGALYVLGVEFLLPFVTSTITGDWAKTVSAVIVCIAMIPIIVLMCSNKSVYFTKLWIKNRYNRMPLIALIAIRICAAAGALVITLEKFLHLPLYIVMPIAIIVIGFAIRLEFLKSAALKIEMRFIGNMNERYLQAQKEERGDDRTWLDEKMWMLMFKVVDHPEHANVMALGNSNYYHVTVAKIVRDGKRIIMPGPEEEIRKGDELHVLGTRAEIDACLLMLQKTHTVADLDEDPLTLKDYIYAQVFEKIEPEDQLICVPVKVEAGSFMDRKMIKYCQFRERYKGYIIGVERSDLDLVNPDINTELEAGDLIWAIGSQTMADRLLKSGLWDIETKKRIKRNMAVERK